MISSAQASQLILSNKTNFGVGDVELLSSTGRILAQDVIADRDFPPFNRVMMDGIAINTATFNSGISKFKIENIQAAGAPQLSLSSPENCIEVMTGATLPANTNAVIPYEQVEINDRFALVDAVEVTPMQSVHLQGIDSKKGELLLEKGEKITPAVVGIMASVGLSRIKVFRLPRITICSTGDELVEVSAQPEAHQIRRSNLYMLASALLSEGIEAETLHLADKPEQMKTAISALLTKSDVILFSGAVSKGKFDYLPVALKELGMEQVFHSVAQRPGKPFLFGRFKNGPLVFGFPGNPVSTFVCYHQFFKPWLHQCLRKQLTKQTATLASDVRFKPPLSYQVLVKLSRENGVAYATPISNSGSGDLVTLTKAEGIITLPADRDVFKQGEVFELNVLN